MSAPVRAAAVAVLLLAAVAGAIVWGIDASRPTPGGGPADGAQDAEALLEGLATADPATWKRTVGALAALGAPAVAPLTHALASPHRATREGAAHALGDIGGASAPAVDVLLRVFVDDDDDFVRWKAARALGRIGPAAAKALPELRRAAADARQSEIVRATAERAVALIASGS